MFEKSKLRKAILANDAERITAILARIPELLEQKIPGTYAYGPLAYALMNNKNAAIDAIIAAGASVADTRPVYGANILHHAARYGCVKYLKAWAVEYPEMLHAIDQYGYSILHAAAYSGHAETTRFLLAQGLDALAQNNRGQTAYAIADQRGSHVVAALLKPFYDAEILRLSQQSGMSVQSRAPATGPQWYVIDPHTIAYSREDTGAGYRLTDIFNFALHTCVTLHCNLQTNTETAVRHDLAALAGTPALLTAQEKLMQQGGALPSAPAKLIIRKDV